MNDLASGSKQRISEPSMKANGLRTPMQSLRTRALSRSKEFQAARESMSEAAEAIGGTACGRKRSIANAVECYCQQGQDSIYNLEAATATAEFLKTGKDGSIAVRTS